MDGKQLWELVEGLEANDLLYYTHLLTGVCNLIVTPSGTEIVFFFFAGGSRLLCIAVLLSKLTVFHILILFLVLILVHYLDLSHVLSGYIGSVSFLSTVLEVVSKLRSINPELLYGKT